MNKQKLLTEWTRKTKKYERALFNVIKKQLKAYYLNSFLNFQRDYKDYYADKREALSKSIERTLKAHYRRVIPDFGKWAVSNIKSQKKGEIKFTDQFFNSFVQNWIEFYALRRANSISATAFDSVKKRIDEGYRAGNSPDDIAASIRKLQQLTPYQALRIARTETHDAANFAGYESAQKASEDFNLKMGKVWIAVQDERTRDSHSEVEEQGVIAMDEKFNVGNYQARRPHDPSLPADEIINCRCTLGYELLDD